MAIDDGQHARPSCRTCRTWAEALGNHLVRVHNADNMKNQNVASREAENPTTQDEDDLTSEYWEEIGHMAVGQQHTRYMDSVAAKTKRLSI
ncbi:hypothetical protein E8E14_011704 [Neopestalotiopsis sp. 37M]|nr:hypothetical protein E8E14_011704 [Neopestalotiopsis sp. 37M]